MYPDDEDDDLEDESEEEDDDSSRKDSKELEAVRFKLVALRDTQRQAQELLASAESRLKILDAYGKSLGPRKAVDIESGIEAYRHGRETVFQDHMQGTVRLRELATKIADLVKEEKRLLTIQQKEEKKEAKVKAKAKKEKDKVRQKEQLRKAEKEKEKARIRKEREKFWPLYCWSIRITLDVVSFTPGSSRRSSIASAGDIVKVVPEKESTISETEASASFCDMSLSYVTSSAWWSPSYDLSLNTTSNTARLCFDAQLTNKTSENWAGCKVVLSTSQTTFSGIQDAIPTLVPWRIRLGPKGFGAKPGDVLDSREERAEKGGWVAQQNAWGNQKARSHLYGLQNSAFPSHPKLGFPVSPTLPPPPPAPSAPVASAMYARGPGAQPQMESTSNGFGATNVFGSNNLFGASSAAAQRPSRNRASKSAGSRFARYDDVGGPNDPITYEEHVAEEGDDAETMLDLASELTFQESAFEETGMTTTYDLPGLKTLNTASTASRQRVARISFSNVVFSHTVVAKYRPVAYLKAKLRNASKFTLLKGPVGLSLDGSFIGRSTLSRCSAGDNLIMSLGIDPGIKVVYPKPEVTRSTSGLFTKEDSYIYTRTVIISNTNASSGKPVNLVVLDQVPVSEDDKLRIEIINPRGMALGSAPVRTGLPAKDGGEGKDWGRATATLKKAGEVCYDVVLNPGRGVKMALQYEVALPAGDQVIQC